MTDQRERDMPSNISETGNGTEKLRQELTGEMSRLSRFSTRGLLALALFLVISMIAWSGFPLFPAPETAAFYLGKPPSPRMISIALLLYTFSAIILSLSRMTAGVEHRSSFSHVGFLAVFFLFYYYGKSLEDNYWAVFGSGVTILGVESYRIWTYCAEGISRCREDLEYVTRTGRPPPQE